jgi:hypothetical protein
MDRAAARHTRGMEDTVETVGHGGQHRRDRCLVSHVSRHEPEFRAKIGRGGKVGADDAAAFGQQALRGGQADAGRRAGHDKGAGTGAISIDHGSHVGTRRIECALMASRVR